MGVTVQLMVDAGGTRYHVLLGVRPVSEREAFLEGRPEAVVGELPIVDGTAFAYDATVDPELAMCLLQHSSDGLTAERAAAMLDSGEVSCRELVGAYLAAIEAQNGELNAFANRQRGRRILGVAEFGLQQLINGGELECRTVHQNRVDGLGGRDRHRSPGRL